MGDSSAPAALKPRDVGTDATRCGVQGIHYGVYRGGRLGRGGRKRDATQQGRIIDPDRCDAFGHGAGGRFGNQADA
jgi:hypothetical protein